MKKFKLYLETIAHTRSGKYFYRVHPKGDIINILKSGLYSISPANMPGSFVDRPDLGRWPDQEIEDPQTSRLYVADSKWSIEWNQDRFRIRIPAELIEDKLERDHLGDYYLDTGESEELILKPNQFDIYIGGRWTRADLVDPIMKKYWHKKYYQPAGHYGYTWHEPDEFDDES